MIKFKGIVIYLGTLSWGWRMFGIGWKTTWFLGLSIQHDTKSVSKRKAIQRGE